LGIRRPFRAVGVDWLIAGFLSERNTPTAAGTLKQAGTLRIPRGVMECGGRAERRHRFRTRERLSLFGRSTSGQSGVALRFPPQSMTVSGMATVLGLFRRLGAGYAIKCLRGRQTGSQRDAVHQRRLLAVKINRRRVAPPPVEHVQVRFTQSCFSRRARARRPGRAPRRGRL